MRFCQEFPFHGICHYSDGVGEGKKQRMSQL